MRLVHAPRQRGTRRLYTVLRRHIWPHSASMVALLCTVLALVWPLTRYATTAIIGTGPDALQSYWNMWWLRWSLAAGTNPYAGELMQHPFGLPLFFHTFNFLHNLLLLPVQLCCGAVVAYNAQVVGALLLAACGMYALVLWLTNHRGAALLAGLVYISNPFVLLHLTLGQLHLLALGWLPLYVLALLRGLTGGRGWLLLAAGLLLALSLAEWHYALYAVLITGLVWLYEGGRLPTWRARAQLTGRLLLVGGVYLLTIAPLLLPMLHELAASPAAVRGLGETVRRSTDVLAYALPSVYHPLWGAWAERVLYGQLGTPGIVGGGATLGYTALALAVAGAWGWWRQLRWARLFVLLGLAFVLLTLGPFAQVGGVNSYDTGRPVALPYLLLRELPLMSIQRVPSRFFVGVLLALAVLAGLGVAWLAAQPAVRRWPRWAQGAALAALLALLAVELVPRPLPHTPIPAAPPSPWFAELAAAPDRSALLEVPHLGNTSSLYQTYHTRPTVGGIIARTPLHPWHSARLFGPLLQVDNDWRTVGAASPAHVRSALACQGIGHVVLYQGEEHRVAEPATLPALERRLFAGQPPAHADALLRAYTVTHELPHLPFWTLAPGEWYDGQRSEQGVFYRWARGAQGSMLIYPCRPPAVPQTNALVSFQVYGFATPRTLDVRAGDQPLGTLALPPETPRRVHLLLPLQPGTNRLTLRSREPATVPATLGFANDERRISFNLAHVSVRPTRHGWPAAPR